MPHDPHAEFDHAVLDQIDHSPIGAVPRTPSYQDAIERLRLSHQIYPDADHVDGFVTVRSLTTRGCFHAENLAAWIEGKIEATALENNAAIFSRYVAALPAGMQARAEALRVRVAGRPALHRKHGGVLAIDPVHTLLLVPGAGPHPGIPGNYLYGSLLQLGADPAKDGWSIHLHDRDDGAAMCDAATLREALEKLQEVIASAPFHLNELGALGFRSN
jgi:hypothetical protein